MHWVKAMKRFFAVLVIFAAVVGLLAGRSDATLISGDAAPLVFPASLDDTTSGKLNTLREVSCVAAGECVGVGEVRDATGSLRAFAVTMTGGVWGVPEAVDFPGSLSAVSAAAQVVDCVAIGECALMGTFVDSAGDRYAFGAFMSGGLWAPAQQILRPAATGGSSPEIEQAGLVSCSAPGVCVFSAAHNTGALWYTNWVAVTSSPGVIGQGTLVAFGSGVAASPDKVRIDGVSCVVSGPCTIVGAFDATGPVQKPFAAEYSSGSWSNAVPITIGVPYLSTFINRGDCVAPGECVMVGGINSTGGYQAITVVQTGGVWGDAIVVPLPPDPASPSDSVLNDVSCSSVGTCAAIGYHLDSGGKWHPWSLHMNGGSWGSPVVVPRVPGSVDAYLTAIDCGSDGVCVTGGAVSTDLSTWVPITVVLWGGVWGVPALPNFTTTSAAPEGAVNGVSCVGGGGCVVVGFHYPVPQGNYQAFSMTLAAPPPTPVGPAYTG